jgi:hypothetical protein
VRSDRSHYTRGFVSGNERESHVAPDAFNGLVVGGANATGSNADQGFIGPRLRNWLILQLEPVKIVQDRG